MKKGDIRRLHPNRLPSQLPITETIVSVLLVKDLELDSIWVILTAIFLTGLWLIRVSQMVVERWIDPFDFEL